MGIIITKLWVRVWGSGRSKNKLPQQAYRDLNPGLQNQSLLPYRLAIGLYLVAIPSSINYYPIVLFFVAIFTALSDRTLYLISTNIYIFFVIKKKDFYFSFYFSCLV